ncbi:MAG: aspartate ammonia-lyase [bacterium]|nr:aspartate ammonia-lyase [bacterium]
MAKRSERDQLGELTLDTDALSGIHTERAVANFPLSGRHVHPALAAAFGQVKLAAITTLARLDHWRDDTAKVEAMRQASRELALGELLPHIRVDALQGGAGTSLNMNVNEVIANRALQILGGTPGDYERVSPLDDVNRCQSTNDTYPTALRVAAITLLRGLESNLVTLQEGFQEREREFAHIVKVGRTQLQDAVLTTLGREMSAYAEAVGRDRWRLYKVGERLRVVNLGGTAIGTGLAAPRRYIFEVVEELGQVAGIALARSENLVDATQNADVLVECSGLLKACATTLLKISGDLRLLSSGPAAGLGELILPARQAGSSIMPGKVNPVIPEAVSQASMQVMGNDAVIAQACAAGSLELNPFLPLVADCLLTNIDLLANSTDILQRHCVSGLVADEKRCRSQVENSTAVATALVPQLGYETAARVARTAAERSETVKQVVVEEGLLTELQFAELVSPEAVCRLGSPERNLGDEDLESER